MTDDIRTVTRENVRQQHIFEQHRGVDTCGKGPRCFDAVLEMVTRHAALPALPADGVPRTAAGRDYDDDWPGPFTASEHRYRIRAIEAEAIEQAAVRRHRIAIATGQRVGLEDSEVEAEAAALDVARLTEAMDFDRVEAQKIIRAHGYVFARNLAAVTHKSDEAARWEKLAFTLYSMLMPSNRRSERIAAEYARLAAIEEKP